MASGYGYRSWWTGRTVRLTAGLVLLVGVVRLGWGWQAGRMLARQVEAIRARGEPAAVADIVIPVVNDQVNAWEHLVKAARAHAAGTDSPRNSNLEYPSYPPFTPEWHQLIAKSEQQNAKAIALARAARQFTQAQLREPIKGRVFQSRLPGLSDGRRLASTVSDAAIYASLSKGDHAEAIERIRDVLHIARTVRQDPFVISELVANGMDGLACETTMIIAPGLGKGVEQQKARELIEELLDERVIQESLARRLQYERIMLVDYFEWRTEDYWVLAPLGARESARANRAMEVVVEAARHRDAVNVRTTLGKIPAEEERGEPPFWHAPRYSRWFEEPGIASYERFFIAHFRSLAERRMTAVNLAIQLYRIDQGRWPVSASELAPRYLKALPDDPFHADGRKIRYVIMRGQLPGGKDRPLLYYEEGPELPESIAPTPMYGWQYHPTRNRPRTDATRQYRELSRFDPPPLPKAVDRDPEEPDTPGEDSEQNNRTGNP